LTLGKAAHISLRNATEQDILIRRIEKSAKLELKMAGEESGIVSRGSLDLGGKGTDKKKRGWLGTRMEKTSRDRGQG